MMFNQVLFDDEMAKSEEAGEKAEYYIEHAKKAQAEADGYLDEALRYIDIKIGHNARAKQLLLDAGVKVD